MMPDETAAPVPAQPQPTTPVDSGAAPVIEPTPPQPPPAGPDIAELDKLRQENARLSAERAAADTVLRLLGSQQQQIPEQPVALVRLAPERARRVAQSLGGGWTEQNVQEHVPIFAAFLQELATPILTGLEGMADVVDLVQARQEVKDYETFSEEVDRLRGEYRQRGQTITRKQAVAAVRSRRMETPEYMDKLLAAREQERAAEQQRRAAGAAAVMTEGGATVQKAGPEPTKQPRAPQSKEEFARLSLEDKRKVMDGMTI